MADSQLPTSRAVETLRRVTGALAGGEQRPGQEQMAAAVEQALRGRRHLVVQAGTGTGKSLGYLVPAVLSGRRVVVATATLALQDQLIGKDLPFLAANLGRPVDVALLKGRSNYACRQRLNEVEVALTSPQQLGMLATDAASQRRDGGKRRDPDPEELKWLLTWASTSPTGDRADLSREPTPQAWAAVSVGSRECPGATRCSVAGECFAEGARARAANADVVVVNLHLYAQHLLSGGAILPPHEAVVVDEAHQFEDVMAESGGIELGGGRLRLLALAVGSVIDDPERRDKLEAAADRVSAALAASGTGRLRRGPGQDLEDAVRLAREQASAAITALRALPDGGGGDLAGEHAARRLRSMQLATGLVDDLDRLLISPDGDVTWIEGTPGREVLRVAPVDVRPMLESLWTDSSVVLTSATIPDALADRLGAPADRVDVLDVGSPFDYQRQALLYCAADLPDPRSEAFEEAAHREIERLIVATGGRTLALFTSHRAMAAAAEHLGPRLPWAVLRQGDLPRPALLRRFADDEESCLFATISFWQGVDVPGPGLSLVVIDRLPFPRPDEPLMEARRENAGARAFRLVDLPRAATLLAQGAGRLIRRSDDQGVVAVLDRRLACARSYRWDLVRALPPMPRTRDREVAEARLRELRGG